MLSVSLDSDGRLTNVLHFRHSENKTWILNLNQSVLQYGIYWSE